MSQRKTLIGLVSFGCATRQGAVRPCLFKLALPGFPTLNIYLHIFSSLVLNNHRIAALRSMLHPIDTKYIYMYNMFLLYIWPPYLGGQDAISDEPPALVEEGVLHPVWHKPRDLSKTRRRVSMVQIHISDVPPALVEEGVLHPVRYKPRDLSKTRRRVSMVKIPKSLGSQFTVNSVLHFISLRLSVSTYLEDCRLILFVHTNKY